MKTKIYKKEGDLVVDIKIALEREYPGFYFKTHGGAYQKVGLPDIIGCHKGRMIGIEVKLPGKEDTLTKIQKNTIEKLSRCGAISFMTTSVEGALKGVEDGR